jgi:hypothetical protein
MSRFHQLMFEAGMRAAALLVPRPAPAPAIGDALEGGYYTGTAWDTVTSGSGTLDLSAIVAGDAVWLAVPDGPHPIYLGQLVRLAPTENTPQVFLEGRIRTRTPRGVQVAVTAVTGSGSFSAWVIAARWKVIVAPKIGGESTSNMQYKIETTAAPVECRTLTNGRAATAAMIAANTAAGSIIYPAADFVRGVNAAALSGYTDWELPARDWLELIWRNLKPVTLDNYIATRPKSNSYIRDANIDDVANEGRGLNRHSVPPGGAYTAADPAQTNVSAFRSGGDQSPPWEIRFWSSSEYSATHAWLQLYDTSYPGYQHFSISRTLGYRVRAVRRSIL